MLSRGRSRSFNCITMDGDTSTNDSFMLIATGAAGTPDHQRRAPPGLRGARAARWRKSLSRLAQAIMRDGEGATKFMTVQVEGGKTKSECGKVAYAIAHSPLVKTAFFASDPNLGRHSVRDRLRRHCRPRRRPGQLYLGDVLVAKDGGRNPAYREEDGQRVMQQSEITVRVELGRGKAETTVWTCDLSHDYVSINADYRS